MYRTYCMLISFCVVFLSLFITQLTLAEEIIDLEQLQKTMVKAKPINQGGFIFDIKRVAPELLAEDVEKLRGFYLQRQHELSQLVENKKLNAGDALITVIIPGGLLYAGYRKQELEKARSALLAVTSEIRELSDDLLILQDQVNDHLHLLAQHP